MNKYFKTGKNSMCFENADLFTKLHVFINQVPRPLKLDGTERLTFLTRAFVIFLQGVKV